MADPAPAAPFTPEQLRKRREAARKEYDAFQPMRDEAYQYAIPYRKSASQSGPGEKRSSQAFDHTAPVTAFRFAGRLQQDIWPAEQENFALEPGPLVIDEAERKELEQQLSPTSKIASAFFDDPDWGLSFHEMAIDLSAGTGAILMDATDEPGKLWAPMSAPIDELILEAGANGKVSGIFWDRTMTLRLLDETWPDGDLGPDLKRLLAENPEREVKVHYDTVRKRQANRAYRWHLLIWCDDQKDRIIFARESRTCPWLTPRYFRVPGETYGRGLVTLAMPAIKTANTATRLQLQAAAIAMLGIYTAIDDGVFNPDLSPIQPGAFWKVARNGGNLGPTVERFPDPRLDLNQLVLQDIRSGIKSTMMDDDLPMNGEAVKSPTEIIERIKKAAADHLGAFERLVKEIILPAVSRVLELAYDKGLIPNTLPIDNLLFKVRIKSPAAIARATSRIEKVLQWLQMVIQISEAVAANPSIELYAKVDLILEEASRSLGVDPKFRPTDEEKAKVQQKLDVQQAAMALAAGGAGVAA